MAVCLARIAAASGGLPPGTGNGIYADSSTHAVTSGQ